MYACIIIVNNKCHLYIISIVVETSICITIVQTFLESNNEQYVLMTTEYGINYVYIHPLHTHTHTHTHSSIETLMGTF